MALPDRCVLGVLIFAAAAVYIALPQKITSITSAPVQLPSKLIETSRGTCECVPYFKCDTENTVDTVIYRIRLRRQIEVQPEQCDGLFVCCLLNKTTTDSGTDKNNINNNGGSSGNSNNINNGGSSGNSNNNTNGSSGGNTNENISQPDSQVPCTCLPSFQCGQNDTEVITGGKGIILPKISCLKNEVLCCHKSFAEGTSKPNEPSSSEEPEPSVLFPSIPSQCGIRKTKDFTNNIINRIKTSKDGSTIFGEYPWMLVLLRSETLANGTTYNSVFQCGASLVQPNIAITAAHCVFGMDVSALKVRAGEWDTRADNEEEVLPYQEQKVSQVIIHPKYNNGTLFNDIAILRLESPFELRDNVGIVCLPSPSDNLRTQNPSNCIATGWGKEAFSEDASFQSILRQVQLPVVQSNECQRKLRQTQLGRYFELDESFLCAGGKSDQDTCLGDGGGPLSCLLEGDASYYLMGITSWGVGCGKKDVPGVYTKVQLFTQWISTYLK